MRRIWIYGAGAGVIAGAPLFALPASMAGGSPPPWGMAVGYLIMLTAFSLIFLAVKRRRDRDLGGTIGFWPALGMGLAISAVAGVIYVLAWEATLALWNFDFAGRYAEATLAQKAAAGASAEELAKLKAEMDAFAAWYAQPILRMGITFLEIFPVGVLVSLVAAGLLRNSRFLPARGA